MGLPEIFGSVFAVWVVVAISRSALENLHKGRRSQTYRRVIETSDDPEGCRLEVERLTKWLVRRPRDAEAWLARGLYHQVLRDLKLATADLTRAAELNPDDPYLLLSRAQLLLFQEQSELALADLDRALEIKPSYVDCRLLRAWGLLQSCRREEADQDLAIVLRAPLQDAHSLVLRAHLRLALRNDYEGAARDAEVASTREKSAGLLYLRASCREQLGQKDEADRLFRELATFETNDPMELAYRGYARFRVNSLEEARHDLVASRDASPFDARTRRCLVVIHLKLGEMDDALIDCEAVLSGSKGDAQDYSSRALILNDRGDYAAAISDYQRAIEIDPSDGTPYNGLAWLLATCPDDAMRNGPEAVRLARLACELLPSATPYSQGTLAAALAECGDFEGAIQWEETAQSLARGEERKEWTFLQDLYRAGRAYRAPLHDWRDRARTRLAAAVG